MDGASEQKADVFSHISIRLEQTLRSLAENSIAVATDSHDDRAAIRRADLRMSFIKDEASLVTRAQGVQYKMQDSSKGIHSHRDQMAEEGLGTSGRMEENHETIQTTIVMKADSYEEQYIQEMRFLFSQQSKEQAIKPTSLVRVLARLKVKR